MLWCLQLLLKYYNDILAIFRSYCTRGTISDVFNVQWKHFTEFAHEVHLVDRKEITQGDIDTLFIAVNANKHACKLNPERSVCRYEMFEAIVRMANLKYLRSEYLYGNGKVLVVTLTLSYCYNSARKKGCRYRKRVTHAS